MLFCNLIVQKFLHAFFINWKKYRVELRYSYLGAIRQFMMIFLMLSAESEDKIEKEGDEIMLEFSLFEGNTTTFKLKKQILFLQLFN